ncbi:MAG: flagellar assembly protein FliH [Bacillus sp. (in: Bacteria)]|nr:flagellar assembly protein FliH [Bacillus sp. (in: firmicutes)]
MESYSKVFKAKHLSMVEEVKVITQPLIPINLQGDETIVDHSQAGEGNRNDNGSQLVQEANASAQVIIDMAEENARLLEASAAEKVNLWWEENEKKLAAMSLEAKEQGFIEGSTNGRQEALIQVQEEYQGKLVQVQLLLEQAYQQKNLIISEAEPFLLELSTVIASQIIKQELEGYPDKFVELIKQHILRFKEKEFITICVHPDDFEFIQSQRVHLVAVVNGETEIKIIPDHSVSPKGCIIRTAYGSVDARIDTQIEEIKKVILEVRREPESVIGN